MVPNRDFETNRPKGFSDRLTKGRQTWGGGKGRQVAARLASCAQCPPSLKLQNIHGGHKRKFHETHTHARPCRLMNVILLTFTRRRPNRRRISSFLSILSFEACIIKHISVFWSFISSGKKMRSLCFPFLFRQCCESNCQVRERKLILTFNEGSTFPFVAKSDMSTVLQVCSYHSFVSIEIPISRPFEQWFRLSIIVADQIPHGGSPRPRGWALETLLFSIFLFCFVLGEMKGKNQRWNRICESHKQNLRNILNSRRIPPHYKRLCLSTDYHGRWKMTSPCNWYEAS